jgi:hypothetical protein
MDDTARARSAGLSDAHAGTGARRAPLTFDLSDASRRGVGAAYGSGVGLTWQRQQPSHDRGRDHGAASESIQELPSRHVRRRLFRELTEFLKHD